MNIKFPSTDKARVKATGRGLGCLGSNTDGLPPFVSKCRGTVPSRVDLRPLDTPIRNQGGEGSCSAFSTGGLIDYLMKNFVAVWGVSVPVESSEQALYYWSRDYMGTEDSDSGAYAFVELGVAEKTLAVPVGGGGCPDSALWPYSESMFTPPPAYVITDAARRILGPSSIISNTMDSVRACLASGQPFVVPFVVYSSWYDGPKTVMPWPQYGSVVGGHEIMVVAYDDNLDFGLGRVGYCTIRNSWGTGYGDGGYFYFPYAFFAENEGYTVGTVTVDGVSYPYVPPTRVVTDVAGEKATLSQMPSGLWRVTALNP